MRHLFPALLCAAALSLATAASAADNPPTSTEQAKAPVSPTAALLADLAEEVVESLGDVQTSGVAVATVTTDTRLERALQEAVVTALFEKGIPVLETPAAGAPTVHLVAFATPVAATSDDHSNILSKGFSVVRNVIVADPRVSLVTKPFARDGKKAPDATLLVTVSVAKQGRFVARKTNAYTLPGSEPFAQLALTTP
jgi:hypothetical protein